MMSVDTFFDSFDVLSVDDELVQEEEEAEFQVWSDELVSVEERRERFLKKMGLFECSSLDRINDNGEDEVSSSSSSSDSSSGETEMQCCVREENYGSTNSMSDEELDEETESEHNKTDVSLSPSRSFKKKWLFKFNCFAREKAKDSTTISKVKVKSNKKNPLELSAVYKVQEINGHKGKIWTLKFSPNGKFLATGGEDGVVKIWRITLTDSLFASLIKQELISQQQDEMVLFPQKAFHIEETPFQELYGHTGDVLDLAWSDSNLLLSASKDKTVRLWRIGYEHCLHVFHHNNYMTCVQFNPVNKNNFISGSIDGKARIWGLTEKRVIAWTDVRDSITAISYQQTGNEFVVGCINGSCKFYQISSAYDVLLEEQIVIRGRNRITAVQFCPGSSDEVMVSSDDSKLRIIDKNQILHKFKASSKSEKQSSASFVSSAGKHILSVRRGHGVYLWNNGGFPSRKRVKSTRSFEYFQSPGISSAAAWSPPGARVCAMRQQVLSSGRLARSSRVTATWPEEKLAMSGFGARDYDVILPVDEFEFAGAWRMVIVTASVDGIIRTFHNYGLPRRL